MQNNEGRGQKCLYLPPLPTVVTHGSDAHDFFLDPKAECYANAGGGGIEKANEIALVHGLHYSGSF